MNKGIMVAGNILVDKLNEIAAFPAAGELTKILSFKMAAGGCVPNVAADLAAIDPSLKVYACGAVGKDEEGTFVTAEMSARGVDVENVKIIPSEKTSFTEVMSVAGGERTFFTYAGASALFGDADVALDPQKISMLHLGYFLLLDKMDAGDGLKLLRRAKAAGIKTSIDLVSENSDRYSSVLPCLEYVDNLIINEIEGGKLSGVAPERENLYRICTALKGAGVRERVIIHMPEVCACLSERGYLEMPSFDLPEGFIKGSTGAGDAFCAGALTGIYRGDSEEDILHLASCEAALSLRTADAVSGVIKREDALEFCSSLKKRN